MVGFAVATITGKPPGWELDAFSALTRERRTERIGNALQPMPVRIDAALHIVVADKLLARDDRADGLTELGHAVETVPGLADLIRFEDAITRGEDPVLHLNKFVLGEQEFVDWDKTDDDLSAATEPEPTRRRRLNQGGAPASAPPGRDFASTMRPRRLHIHLFKDQPSSRAPHAPFHQRWPHRSQPASAGA